MSEEEILNALDRSGDGSFAELGQVYSYLIDTRLNVFRGDSDRWALAIERLGYNPRAGAIILEINYYGNCLLNLDVYNERPTNMHYIYPVDSDSFEQTVDGENLRRDAKFWLARGEQVKLSHDKQDYIVAGIALKEYEPDEIRVEEAARLIVSQNGSLFRASDFELYKSIPSDLNKILVLDEWFHKDFQICSLPVVTDDQLRQAFELNKTMTSLDGFTSEEIVRSYKEQELLNDAANRQAWENNRPSCYETWRLIAKVMVTGDPRQYRPTLQPNTHWSNWPDSGSM